MPKYKLDPVDKGHSFVENELDTSKSRIRLVKPEGTYQIWLDFRELFEDSKVMFHHITEHSGIAMNAGHWFGREGALFMRMNIGTSNEKVLGAIKRIIRVEQEID